MRLPETRYARSGDYRIAYQVVGQGALDLVLVPGFLSNLEVHWEDPGYARLLRRLSGFTRLIHFDKRGTGLSDRVDPAHLPDLETRMDDVRAVMDAAGKLDRETEVEVATDGLLRRQDPGAILRLHPGESVTLMPGNWHAFWGEGGDALIGEVSTVNNDLTDNIFEEPIGRFAEIEEDAEPLRLLVSDYPRWFG